MGDYSCAQCGLEFRSNVGYVLGNTGLRVCSTRCGEKLRHTLQMWNVPKYTVQQIVAKFTKGEK